MISGIKLGLASRAIQGKNDCQKSNPIQFFSKTVWVFGVSKKC